MIIKKVRPLATTVVVTKEKYAIDEVPKGVLIDPKKVQGSLKEYQKVVAVGDMVRNVKVGELVCINPEQYAQYESYRPGDGMRSKLGGQAGKFLGYSIPTIEIDGVEHLMIQERDITFVVEEWEEEKKESPLIHVQPQIIV